MGSKSSGHKSISFEFFPPNSERALEKLVFEAEKLLAFNPEFFSVTFGAGGGTRRKTLSAANLLYQKLKVPIAPHISCVSLNANLAQKTISEYIKAGHKHLVVLRGDMPSGVPVNSDFKYAMDLVKFISREFKESIYIDVAAYPECHPESMNFIDDINYFKKKVEAGADRAITQYFFNCDAYYRFVEDCTKIGIKIPILAGLMPISNGEGILRFSKKCNADIPKWLKNKIEYYSDDNDYLTKLGIDFVSQMCESLIDNGVPGFHFYTLNKSYPTVEICKNLGFDVD